MLSPDGASGVLRMVEIVDGLKAKLVEIDSQIGLLQRQIGTLEESEGRIRESYQGLRSRVHLGERCTT
jgi:prefoldin subunit 5